MIKAPIPKNEKIRLKATKAMNLLDTPKEKRFDRITLLATHLFDVPTSTITIVDMDREWYKSCQGVKKHEYPRATSFCGHTVLEDKFLIVNDTLKDERFKDNPMVLKGPKIRFYAGIVLTSPDGQHIGAFCVKDNKPRKFNDENKKDLESLARWVELEMKTKKSI